MQQTTPQPGQPGGPGSVRRPPEAAPPVIRTRQEPGRVVRPRRPSSLLRALEGLQSYILSEEMLILVEFVIVVAIGLQRVCKRSCATAMTARPSVLRCADVHLT